MWTWTQAANVIFIEQPAGVGFSYSDTPSDYTTGDYQSSQDVLAFMLGFLARYPQYANRPFFISGERLVHNTRDIPSPLEPLAPPLLAFL
jgi:carboxypeptidase C (cathepsin A)